MELLSPKERLLRVLEGQSVDRPPVICTGGMMNAAIVDVMENTGHVLPEAHKNEEMMTELARDVSDYTGFENLGVPFCMTVEAENLGAEINFGTLECEPKIDRELFPSVSQVEYREISRIVQSGRTPTVLQAAYRLSRKLPDIPVTGNLTGPITTAASIVDPITFLKELRKDPSGAHRVMDYVSEYLLQYAQLMVDSGVSVITIGDPTATGEILGPKLFEDFALPYLNKVIDGVHDAGAPVIVHICGNMNRVKHLIPSIRCDAISTDAMVNLRLLKDEFPQLTTMGNLSTYLLEFGDPEKISEQTVRLVRDGIDIISPACGLSTSTTLQNINALTQTVREKIQ